MKIADLDFDKEDKKRSAPKDRIPIIKEVFELVLNREPSSRELSFYKYGTQEKEEIIEKLLNDKEHKEALEKVKEFPELEKRAKDAEHKVIKLKQQTKDQKIEIEQTNILLNEKNKEIAILRREKEDPYNFTHSDALRYIRKLTENRREEINEKTQDSSEDKYFTNISSTTQQKKKTFFDKIYDLIRTT
jgi:hypothetical protein